PGGVGFDPLAVEYNLDCAGRTVKISDWASDRRLENRISGIRERNFWAAQAQGLQLVMRGIDARQSAMFSYLSPEQRVPKDHPLRRIRVASVVNANTVHGIGSKLIIS